MSKAAGSAGQVGRHRQGSAAAGACRTSAHRQKRHGADRGRPRLPHRLCAGAAARHHRRGAHQPGAGADRKAARLRRHHRRSAHRICLARALSRRESDRRVAGHGAAAAQRRPLHGVRRAHPRSEDRRSGADSMRCRATVSISARSARGKRMRAASSGSRRKASATPLSPASMRRSGSISARCRRPRSPSPSWRKSPSGCARKANPPSAKAAS